jgi:hypothetical protein
LVNIFKFFSSELRWPFGPGELKNEEKRAITPRRVIRFTSGHVDLDKLNMFAV